MKAHRLFCAGCLLLISSNAQALQFYVSPTGNDAGTGTAGDPWQTLQHAANQVAAGDTVNVAGGTYVGFQLTASGTQFDPIVFQAAAGVTINQANASTDDGINLEQVSHVTLDGFSVTGVPRAGIRVVGIDGSHSQGVVLRNNIADQNGRWGILTGYTDDILIEHNQTSRSGDEHGIYVSNSGDRPIIRRNLVWGNNASGIQINADGTLPGDGIVTGALVENNTIFDNGTGGGSALNFDGLQDSRIQNNLLYDNHSSGISLYRIDGSDGSKNNVVVNNTVLQAADGRWALNVQDGSTGNFAANNILLNDHSFRGSLDISSDSLSGFVSDNNVVMDRFTTDGGNTVLSLSQWQSLTGQDAASLIALPDDLFVDPDNDNYHLAELSPAIDAGTSLQAPAFDLEGTPRPLGAAHDIGAFEAVPEPSGIVLAAVGSFALLFFAPRNRNPKRKATRRT